jgi:hypothetical protein
MFVPRPRLGARRGGTDFHIAARLFSSSAASIQRGFVQRTPRGRLITGHAFAHLGLAEPARDAAQFRLFDEAEEGGG